MPEFEALAKRVKAARIKNNESQEDFGANCGISTDEVSNIENLKTDPKLSTLQHIAAHMDITVSDMLNTFPPWNEQ